MVALMNSVPFKRFHSPPTVCRVCFRLYMNTVFRCRGTKTWHDKGVSVLPVWCLADNQTASETLRHQGWWAAFQNQPSENHAHFTQGLARSVEVRCDLFFLLNATTFVCSCVHLSATPLSLFVWFNPISPLSMTTGFSSRSWVWPFKTETLTPLEVFGRHLVRTCSFEAYWALNSQHCTMLSDAMCAHKATPCCSGTEIMCLGFFLILWQC